MKQEVIKFCQATGQYEDINSKDELFSELNKLYPKLLSEIKPELKTSIDMQYVKGVADDFADILLYVYQIESLLERAGIDVVGIKQAVASNNSLKYTTSIELACKWLKELEKGLPYFGGERHPNYISENSYDGETYYCIKRKSDDKVMKWVNFPSPKLDKYIPKEYGGNK